MRTCWERPQKLAINPFGTPSQMSPTPAPPPKNKLISSRALFPHLAVIWFPESAGRNFRPIARFGNLCKNSSSWSSPPKPAKHQYFIENPPLITSCHVFRARAKLLFCPGHLPRQDKWRCSGMIWGTSVTWTGGREKLLDTLFTRRRSEHTHRVDNWKLFGEEVGTLERECRLVCGYWMMLFEGCLLRESETCRISVEKFSSGELVGMLWGNVFVTL